MDRLSKFKISKLLKTDLQVHNCKFQMTIQSVWRFNTTQRNKWESSLKVISVRIILKHFGRINYYHKKKSRANYVIAKYVIYPLGPNTFSAISLSLFL